MEAKLDQIIALVTNLNEKFEALDTKVENLTKKMDNFEERMNKKLALVDNELQSKASIALCNELQDKISSLEGELDVFYTGLKKNALMKESYEKRLNIMVHGIREAESPWEKREESRALFQKFMKDGLQIEDPDAITIVDVHRIPQRPKFDSGKRVCRPLIVKLNTILDKNTIFAHVKNLKVFNETRNSTLLHDNKSAYISDHLPREFVLQKKKLYPQFKAARAKNHKPYWRIEDGSYNLYINNTKV